MKPRFEGSSPVPPFHRGPRKTLSSRGYPYTEYFIFLPLLGMFVENLVLHCPWEEGSPRTHTPRNGVPVWRHPPEKGVLHSASWEAGDWRAFSRTWLHDLGRDAHSQLPPSRQQAPEVEAVVAELKIRCTRLLPFPPNPPVLGHFGLDLSFLLRGREGRGPAPFGPVGRVPLPFGFPSLPLWTL